MTEHEKYRRWQAVADEELRMFQEQQKQLIGEPLEAIPYVPYTDTAQFGHRITQMEQSLREMHEIQEAEQQARIEMEQKIDTANRKQVKENRIWQAIGVTIGLLTLVATIFGLIR